MTTYTNNRTSIGLTVTTEGEIPHRWATLADGSRIRAPVLVDRPLKGTSHPWPRAHRDRAGRLQYVLPNGERVL